MDETIIQELIDWYSNEPAVFPKNLPTYVAIQKATIAALNRLEQAEMDRDLLSADCDRLRRELDDANGVIR